MGGTSFLVNVEHPEIRVAEVRDGHLHDLDIERDGRLLGDIYKGKIANILPGMDAAFIDVGLARNALIYVGDADDGGKNTTRSIREVFAPGDDAVVQVVRPPVGTKGARVSQRLSLPGRYMVLISGSDSIGVSRRIEGHEERERLRRLAGKIRPLDHGIVIRTEAEGVSEAELARDAEFLWRHLQQVRVRAEHLPSPALLHREIGLLGRLARDRIGAHVDIVLVDSREEFVALRDLVQVVAPQFASRIVLYEESIPLFDRHGVGAEIARANERTVPLPHGGYLAIDEAEALTAIDVNTGKFVGKSRLADTVLQTNLEAVEEATRQLRLRNIGGVVVIDFIDMERSRDRIRVMNALELALKADRTRTRIVQLSPLGLVEMTRRREGDSLRTVLNRPCPYCDGDGVIQSAVTVATDARRRLREAARLRNTKTAQPSSGAEVEALQITMHPETAAAFVGLDSDREAFEAAVGRPVFVKAAPGWHLETLHIEVAATTEFEAQRARLQIGARCPVPESALMRSEFLADFAVVDGCLVQIVTPSHDETGGTGKAGDVKVVSSPVASPTMKEDANDARDVAVLEITSIGRWFCTAQIVVRSSRERGQ